MRRVASVVAGPILAAIIFAAGCKPQPPKDSSRHLYAPDACRFVLLSKEALLKATADAKGGSIGAERKLWNHYSCVDGRQATYWQDRLIEANDADALLSRSSTLDLEASRLSDSDPCKLAMLRTAQSLEARGRKARGNGVMKVFINGKDVSVPYSSAPDEGTRRLANEIDRLSARRSK